MANRVVTRKLDRAQIYVLTEGLTEHGRAPMVVWVLHEHTRNGRVRHGSPVTITPQGDFERAHIERRILPCGHMKLSRASVLTCNACNNVRRRPTPKCTNPARKRHSWSVVHTDPDGCYHATCAACGLVAFFRPTHQLSWFIDPQTGERVTAHVRAPKETP